MKQEQKEKLIPELRFKEFEGEWKSSKLQDIAKFSKGKNISKVDIDSNGKYPCIRYGELYTHYKEYARDIISKTNLDKDKLVFSKNNDVIIPASGETAIDISTAVYIDKDDIALGGDLNIISSPLYGHFLALSLSNKKKKAIARLAQGISVIHLYPEHLKTVEINYPSLPEQQKISSFLSLIDKKIELLNKKKELLEIYKKGIMHNIFNRDIRFKDSNGNDYPEWEEKRLGEIFKERAERGNNDLELLSVTQDRGVVKRTEIDAIDNSNDNKDSYKKVCIGDIAYNSMRMWQGASGLSPYQGIVSPAYTVIYTDENTDFYSYMFKWPRVVYNFRRYSQGLTSDTWNLKYPLFSEVNVYSPQLEEQTKIATFLPQLDKLLINIVRQVETVASFKRGLLQKMFV